MTDQDEMVEALRVAVDNENRRDATIREALMRLQAIEMRMSNLEALIARHLTS